MVDVIEIAPETLEGFSAQELGRLRSQLASAIDANERRGRELPEGLNLEQIMSRLDLVDAELARRRMSEAIKQGFNLPDPAFLIDRLHRQKEALSLSSCDASWLAGEIFTIQNLNLTESDPSKPWARISFEQEKETIRRPGDLGPRLEGVDSETIRKFQESRGPIYVLKLKLEEAFHIRGTHWLPVPASGSCPTSHPNRRRSPEGEMRCYTNTAAAALRGASESATELSEQERPSLKAQTYILSKERFETQGEANKWMDDNDVPRPKIDETETSFRYRQFSPDRCQAGSQRTTRITNGVQIVGCRLKPEFREQAEKLTNERATLREANMDNPTERCGLCTYFRGPSTCQIVDGPVGKDLVCDWIFSRETEAGLYEISDENWLAFVGGMIERQPYQHIVRDGAITPEGPVVMIEDTAEPPHRFSLTKKFHVEHTSLEHHWTQAEVDELVRLGKVELSEAFRIDLTYRPEDEPTHEQLEERRAEILKKFEDFVRAEFPKGEIKVQLENLIPKQEQE